MTTLLAGDIGGTKTILRFVQADPGASESSLPTLTTLHEQTYPSQEFSDLVPIVLQFMAEVEATLGQSPSPQTACFGIAGPVVNNTTCELTNLSWFLDTAILQRELKIPHVTLINDFAAIGYGVTKLDQDDLYILQSGEPNGDAPIAVIGAGTGLGQGFVIPEDKGYRIFPSEGGHVDFAPRSELEFQLVNYVKELHNIDRVSVERIVSGMGIAAIYQFLRTRYAEMETPAMQQAFNVWQQEIGKDEKTVDLAAEVSKAAQTGNDYLSEQTMKLFIEAYGMEAGNLALKLLPYGGLYIAGGIAAKNLDLMKNGLFLNAFNAKGRIRPMIQKVPVYVVLNPKVGLMGAAVCAAQLLED